MRQISLPLLLLALAFPALAAGSARDVKLTLVAYSTPKEAYGQLIPAFQKTAAGSGISFSQSYGASGEQSRAVAAGLGACGIAARLPAAPSRCAAAASAVGVPAVARLDGAAGADEPAQGPPHPAACAARRRPLDRGRAADASVARGRPDRAGRRAVRARVGRRAVRGGGREVRRRTARGPL